jgi:hypothetical protein
MDILHARTTYTNPLIYCGEFEFTKVTALVHKVISSFVPTVYVALRPPKCFATSSTESQGAVVIDSLWLETTSVQPRRVLKPSLVDKSQLKSTRTTVVATANPQH